MNELGTVPVAPNPIVPGMYAYQRLEAWKQAHRALMLTLRATDSAYHPRSRRVAREAGYLPLPVVRDLEATFGKALATLSGLFKSLHPPRSKSASPRL